jgi:uncharacterized protein YkwD
MPRSRSVKPLVLIGLFFVGLSLIAVGRPGGASGATTGSPKAAVAAACANADLVPAAGNLAQIDTALLCLVNRARVAAGLVRLRKNSHLASAALRHSRDMARTVTFSHIGPAGDSPLSRVHASGYARGSRSLITAENLAWEPTSLSTPAAVVAAWLASAEHRGHILDPRFRDTGIAAVLGPPSHFTQSGGPGVPITEVFAARH